MKNLFKVFRTLSDSYINYFKQSKTHEFTRSSSISIKATEHESVAFVLVWTFNHCAWVTFTLFFWSHKRMKRKNKWKTPKLSLMKEIEKYLSRRSWDAEFEFENDWDIDCIKLLQTTYLLLLLDSTWMNHSDSNSKVKVRGLEPQKTFPF